MENNPLIGITLGDPAGIGPEVVLKALAKIDLNTVTPLIIGPGSVFEHPLIQGLIKKFSIQNYDPNITPAPGQIYFLNSSPQLSKITPAKVSIESGQAAYDAIMTGINLAQSKTIKALVTAPIHKESLRAAGAPYTGHTTLLEKETGSSDVSMAFYSQPLKTVLTTIHTPLKDVPSLITEKTLSVAYNNAKQFCALLKISSPKIAIAGLNPHAGENGLFGEEEIKVITPFIEKLQEQNEPVYGPIPPDTCYFRAHQGDFDMVVSLYHDQGLIPLKLLAFDSAVNITLGLPFLRTSPDHGTAFDIAYQGKASENSVLEALKFAIRYHF